MTCAQGLLRLLWGGGGGGPEVGVLRDCVTLSFFLCMYLPLGCESLVRSPLVLT